MRRRTFLASLGAAAAWPFVARAQKPPMPVIGMLTSRGSRDDPELLAAVRSGLKEAGFVEGQNIAIDYAFAENRNERLPGLAADLVQRKVAVIAATSTPAALAAKAATATIPIVFEMSGDPIRLGLVSNLSHPGGNITGVTQTNAEVAPKRLELLHELIPSARMMALLVNPTDPGLADAQAKDVQAAAQTLGMELHVLNASTETELAAAFAGVKELHAGGLVISTDPFFTSRSALLATLAAQQGVPAAYSWRDFTASGGLLSYGADINESYRLAGAYAGRVLKGEKPGDLPVQEATKVEFYINLKAAKALGITVPLPLLGRADEVIE